MAQQYTSFLLRCWHLEGGEQRYKVEHVQSGEVIQVTTLADAAAWVETRCGQMASTKPVPVSGTGGVHRRSMKGEIGMVTIPRGS